MNTEELQFTLNTISNRASQLLHESLSICTPLYKNQSETHEFIQFIISNLFTTCFSTSESALFLISRYRLWDAHILYRTILEGTVKMMFISLGEESDILEKCDEFWHILPEMKLISRHKKAADFFSIEDNKIDTDTLRPMKDLLLSEDELSNLEERYPKRTRKQLEQKWSFSEMVRVLSSSGEKAYETLLSTYHDYGIGSHLIHIDGDAIGVIWDRNNREQEHRITKELAHGTRMISSILTYAAVRAEIYYKLYGLEQEPLILLVKKVLSFSHEIEEHYTNWMSVEYRDELKRDTNT